MRTHDLGAAGERAARRALRKQGYRVLAANWRCPYGELDLVATHRDVLCFVEVKTQSVGASVDSLEEVTPLKRRRLSRAAAEFLRRTGSLDRPCRFDVVSVTFDAAGRARAEVVRDAFPASHLYG